MDLEQVHFRKGGFVFFLGGYVSEGCVLDGSHIVN